MCHIDCVFIISSTLEKTNCFEICSTKSFLAFCKRIFSNLISSIVESLSLLLSHNLLSISSNLFSISSLCIYTTSSSQDSSISKEDTYLTSGIITYSLALSLLISPTKVILEISTFIYNSLLES